MSNYTKENLEQKREKLLDVKEEIENVYYNSGLGINWQIQQCETDYDENKININEINNLYSTINLNIIEISFYENNLNYLFEEIEDEISRIITKINNEIEDVNIKLERIKNE